MRRRWWIVVLVGGLIFFYWSRHRGGAQQRMVDVFYELRAGAADHHHGAAEFRLAHGDERGRWRRIAVPADRAESIAQRLASEADIVEAFVAPVISLPSVGDDSCPIVTPSYEPSQGYVGPAPEGIDAPAAWRRGVRGAGVWFADVEGNWNAKHEDLPTERISLVAGTPVDGYGFRQHGTAVLGEVVGRDNGKGVTGIAPDVEHVVTASFEGIGVADAIDEAAAALRPGDVLLVELQGTGPRGRYLPVEYWGDVFDAIHAATAKGVVVVEAAGNGGEDLDRGLYRKKLSRPGSRDSGAILVGAGGPPRPGFTDRARLDFSNYGSRVDVQGWGRRVTTLDYGDLQRCDVSGDRHYTGQFAGTSSASPIVAGAAVLLESASGRALGPVQLRELLRDTGSPQTGNTRERIGPRPDLGRALP